MASKYADFLTALDTPDSVGSTGKYDEFLSTLDSSPPATEDGSLLEDVGRTWMGASTRLGGAIGYGLEKLGAETFGGFVRELAKDSSQYWDEGLTQTSKEARQKEFFTKTTDGYEFGDAWTDPRAIGLSVVESLPGTIAGGVAGKAVTGGLMAASLRGTLARGLVAGGVGGTEKVFRLIPAIGPKVAAAIGYGSGEAGVASLSSGGATEDQVRAMSFDVLEQSPEYMAALAATGDREQARDVVARAAGNDAAAMTALTTFVLSAPAGAVLSKFFTNTPLATTRGRAIGLGAGTEAVQEFAQSGSEQISQNVAIRDNADPTRQWDEGALNAAAAGAMAGGVMGGGMGAFQPLAPRPATPDPEAPSRAQTTIDDITNDLRRPYAEAAEEGANQARDIVAQSGGDALSQELAASDVVWSAISQSPTRDDVERTYGRQLQMMQVDEQQAQEAEALRQERLKALDQDGEASVAWMSPGPDGQWRPKAEILGLGRKPARARAGGRGLRGQSDPTWQGQPNEMLGDPAEAEEAEAAAAPAPRWQPTGNTVERVMADLSQDADIGSALGTLTSSRALSIVQSPDQLPPEVQAALSQSAETGAPQGLVWKGRMWLVADSIEAGRARGVLLHEGQHYAMERDENSETYKTLQSNFDRLLESGDVNAVRAMRRVQSANTADVEQERLAYFLEEVVNNPDQASGRERMLAARIMQDVRLWFRETKVGKWLEAHGAGFNLTPQEIVQIVKRGLIRQAQTEARTAAPGGLQASRRGERTDLGLYSALSRNVVSSATNAAPSAGWKSAITGMVNKGQVKQEEVEWSGVMDWLDTQGGKVTKEQVADYLDSGGVQVEETVLGMSEASRTKYDGYRAPGGENYREVLLRLPTGGPSKLEAMSASKLRAVIARIDRNADTDEMSRDELLEMINYMVEDSELTDRDFAEYVGKNAATYKSSHWDQPNVLAHMRVDDRVDTEGKRVLFVNEIQSDWGQEGKKKGFEGDPVFAEGMRGREEGFLGLNASGVPSAPFVTNTSGWVNLALKRAITMASEGGYDRVAVAKGNQNAKLYDQLQDVERVEFLRASEGAYAAPTDLGPGVLRVWGRQGRGGRPRLILDKYLQNPAEAETIIGKDATRKLLEQPGEPSNRGGSPTHIRSLSGLDMQIGGEGMRAFYDEIVPAALKKLLPKVGGAGLRTVTINIDGKPTEQVGFDVTPAMREKAADGVPQFSRRQTETPEFKRWFGDSKVVDADGKPLVVYHGTTRGDIKFSARDRGIFFTSNTKQANGYTDSTFFRGGSQGAVYPAYLSMNNPMVIDAQGKRNDNIPYPGEQWKPKVFGNLPRNAVSVEEAFRRALQAGHDGLVVRNVVDTADIQAREKGDVYVVARAEQIKSAIGNSGQFDPENPDIRFSRRQTDRPVPDAVRQAASLEASFEHVGSTSYARNRDLKVSLQSFVKDAARQARIDLTERTPEVRNHLVRAVIADAKYALRANENAIGWYDRTLKRALKTLSGIHPELETDEQARFAFTWALAVTSNGMKVDKNFELAEQAYAGFKATGRMPVNVGEGTAAGAINDGLAMYNTLVDQLGEETVRKLMVTEFTVKELTDALGVDITGELMDTRVRGAAILGPKIGNGFFSNLYGFYDALTMDRWLMRTWGRWTGTLIDVDPDKVAKARTRLREVRDAVMADPSARTQLKGLLRGTVPLALDKFAKAISKQTVKKEFRASLNLIEAAGWGSAKGDTAGAELRKAANALSNALDGQKESPGNGSERNWIREVFNQALTELKAEYPDLTMSDLQALLWYPEKKLYESSKTDETAEGYEEEAAPDYANAAAKLARKKGVDVDGRTAGTGSGVAQSAPGEQEPGRGFAPQERTAFLVDRFFANQSAELVGTQETQTLLTPAGASAYEAFTQLAGRTDLRSAKARADYVKIQRQTMRELSKKVGGEPSPLAQLISAITGVSDPVLLGVDTNASGTFDSVASPNMRLPMRFKSGKKTVVLTRGQVEVMLAVLGLELKQAAQAASSFKTVSRGAEDTYSVLVEAPAGEDISNSVLQQLDMDLGFPLSYARVPLGWQIDVNIGGFDTRPTIEQVGEAFDKAFGEATIHIVPRAYDSIYLEAKDYGDVLDAFQRAEDPGAGARGGEADGGDGRLGRLESVREAIRQIAEKQDRQLADWDAGVRRRIQFSRAEVESPSAVDAELSNQYNPEPGAESAPDSATATPLADIQITDDYVIAETGETVSVTERADIRLRQLDKRLAVARRLVLCLGG